MFQVATTIVKWVSIPVLLIASVLSRFTASYELLVDCVVCLGAIVIVLRAIRSNEYLWAAGFVAVAVVFSPLLLAVKVFLLMGFTCAVTLATLFVAFRTRPAPAG
jgi:hypothetical protein